MRIVVLGDFSGRASRGQHEPDNLSDRRVVAVDIDNFDDVMARMGIEVHVPLSVGGEGIPVAIRSLDDFHPDALFDQQQIFSSLRASRSRLLDPARFAEEAARWRPGEEGHPMPARATDSRPPATGNNADLLDQMLSEPTTASHSAGNVFRVKVAGVDLARLIDEVVAPYVVPKADPRQAEYVAAVDSAAAELLRRVLHAHHFRRLEAAWRQLWRVTKALTGDSSIKLFLFDVTREELGASSEAGMAGRVPQGLQRALVDKHVTTAGGQPWDELVVLERFGRSAPDCELLTMLGATARAAGGIVLADALPDVVGLTSWTEATDPDEWRLDDHESERRWEALRTGPVAAAIGLAAPRPLVRLPYGKTNPTQRLAFDEIGPRHRHEALLWGSAALACVELIGSTYRRDGESFRLNPDLELEDLPPLVRDEDGEKVLQPGAEVLLTVGAGESLADRGVMPFLSYANRHAARCIWFGTIAGVRL